MLRRILAVAFATVITIGAAPAATPTVEQARSAGTELGRTVTETGRIFGQGGPDGLVLYGMILGTLLMFLLGSLTIYLLLRALAAQQTSCAAQNAAFAEAIKDTGEAMLKLAVATEAQTATNVAHQAALTSVMARMEGALARLDPKNA